MQHDGGAADGIGGEGADEDPLVTLLGEMRDATERMAEAVEANTAELTRLADSQDALSICLHQLTGLATADQLNAGVGVLLLQKLFPEKITDVAIAEAAGHAIARYRDSRQLELFANIEKALPAIRAKQRQAAEEAQAEADAARQREQAVRNAHIAAEARAKAEADARAKAKAEERERQRQREQAQWGDRDRSR